MYKFALYETDLAVHGEAAGYNISPDIALYTMYSWYQRNTITQSPDVISYFQH